MLFRSGDVLDRIATLVRTTPKGEWIVTMPIGEPPFYQSVPGILREGRFPTRTELDRVAPDHPVYIRAIWGHWRNTLPLVSIANSRALERVGITRTTLPPAFGPIHPRLSPDGRQIAFLSERKGRLHVIAKAIAEGLEERKLDKDKVEDDKDKEDGIDEKRLKKYESDDASVEVKGAPKRGTKTPVGGGAGKSGPAKRPTR